MRPTVAVLAVLAASGLALAQQPPPKDEALREIPLQIRVGEKKSVCPCPVSGLICDDPSLVKIVEEPTDVSLEGVKPGTTLCALFGPNLGRRTYRVTVVQPPGRPRR